MLIISIDMSKKQNAIDVIRERTHERETHLGGLGVEYKKDRGPGRQIFPALERVPPRHSVK